MIFSPLPKGGFRLVQGFGERPSVYKQFGMKGHNGLDFAPPKPGQKGVTVYAPIEGYVTLHKGDEGYGNYVTILGLPFKNDGTRRRVDLAHFASFLVKDKSFVAAGDPVGIMGDTGFADGIHTHLTYKLADKDGNALSYKNGYFGATDVLPYIRQWTLDPIKKA